MSRRPEPSGQGADELRGRTRTGNASRAHLSLVTDDLYDDAPASWTPSRRSRWGRPRWAVTHRRRWSLRQLGALTRTACPVSESQSATDHDAEGSSPVRDLTNVVTSPTWTRVADRGIPGRGEPHRMPLEFARKLLRQDRVDTCRELGRDQQVEAEAPIVVTGNNVVIAQYVGAGAEPRSGIRQTRPLGVQNRLDHASEIGERKSDTGTLHAGILTAMPPWQGRRGRRQPAVFRMRHPPGKRPRLTFEQSATTCRMNVVYRRVGTIAARCPRGGSTAPGLGSQPTALAEVRHRRPRARLATPWVHPQRSLGV